MNIEALTDKELIQLRDILKQEEVENARSSLFDQAKYLDPSIDDNDFHRSYYQVLDLFANDIINNLIVTIPPQHGKSTGSTIALPARLFGINPDYHIAISSYSTPITQRFNRMIQRMIDTPEYNELYPDVNLGDSNVVTVTSNPLRNASEFEIVDSRGKIRGKLMSVGRGGSLTSQSVDVWIGDDLYKDSAEGNSPVVREAVWEWYVSVPLSRQPKKKLIVFTRWHEDDVIGRIEKHEDVVTVDSIDEIHQAIKRYGEDVWIKINFEAIKTGKPTGLDNRQKGEALWESHRPLSKIKKIRALDVNRFNCMYQGNPVSQEGLLYKPFKTYNHQPTGIRKNYTDTADSGDNYLCSICYIEDYQGYCYITDIVYTQAEMEVTEIETVNLLLRNKTSVAHIESNSGGRRFASRIDEMTGGRIDIDPFTQTANKSSRIYDNSSDVNRRVIMPEGWGDKFPEFYSHVTGFKRIFKANKYNDAPDALTGIIEKSQIDDPVIIW